MPSYVNLLLVFLILFLPLCIYQFWSWDTAKTTTACTSDDEIDKRSNDTFFIFVQMNPHAVCKLRNNSTSNTLTLLECKADYESIKLNWIIDHFFPWHGVYGLRPCKYKLPCPFDCDEQLCPPFTAGKYEDELTEYWRDPIYSNQLFRWQSEWSHVQPCFQLAQGKPSSSSPSVVYAGEMLNLYKSYNIAARLANHNITPSDTKTYSLVDIKNALNSTVPILGCRLDNIQECVLTRIGLCFNYTNLTPTLIDCPELSSDHHERRPPWILLDYTFEYYTEEGFVCSSNALCTNVTYYGYGHD